MKEVTIISGKGGAGKTTITGALTSLINNAINTDCDVDAADLFLLLQPDIRETHSFSGRAKAFVNNQLCTKCNKCINNCRFDAIHYNENNKLVINEYLCEGCGLCKNICPTNAIDLIQNFNNYWYISNTRNGILIHAHMKPGEENSGKLVSELRKAAKEKALEQKADFIINDGPPGIGCSTIASVTGTDLVIMIIEVTKSGFHDFKRAQKLVDSFSTPMVAILNKYDINLELTKQIELELISKKIPLLAKLPFDKTMVKATISGQTFPEYAPSHPITTSLKKVAHYILKANYIFL